MTTSQAHLLELVPSELRDLDDPQRDLPRLAKDPAAIAQIESLIERVETNHEIHLGDSRQLAFIPDNSVHLVITSPPYWTLKKYRDSDGQLGHIEDYESFLNELDQVWRHCHRVLVQGGRVVCVVGDVCLSRRKAGRHLVMPLHASIQERCRHIGLDNLSPIIWHKIANIRFEVENGSGFLGKPYEPNAVIKNDIEFILMLRKPGAYRNPSLVTRLLSLISAENHHRWFQQIWSGLTGASTKNHPAPFPLQLAERIVRMFSFVGDTVLDPFMGTATTNVAAAKWGRNSIGVEIDSHYHSLALKRMDDATAGFFNSARVHVFSDGTSPHERP